MDTAEILNSYKKIAVLGYSDKPFRESNRIGIYLMNNGYAVFGVNPKLAGKTVDGIMCYGSLGEIPDEIEIVNIFRNPDALPGIIDEVLSLPYKPKVIWTQLEVINDEAREKAISMGFTYIEDKCIYVEHKLNPKVQK
ncbi:MAG: CoA-binding protein [Bacteroidetes bacterium]|nr:CoA-binding protein [Bacteroidota bacterium]